MSDLHLPSAIFNRRRILEKLHGDQRNLKEMTRLKRAFEMLRFHLEDKVMECVFPIVIDYNVLSNFGYSRNSSVDIDRAYEHFYKIVNEWNDLDATKQMGISERLGTVKRASYECEKNYGTGFILRLVEIEVKEDK